MNRVALDLIDFSAGTQVRAAINEQVVTDYAEQMAAGAVFPAVVLFHDGNQYYLADGFHRVLATKRNGGNDIDAAVKTGTRTDALWFALGANKHGLKLTNADKRNAIVIALRTWPDRSQTQIAAQVGATLPYVTRIRSEVFGSLDLPDTVVGRDGKRYPANRPTTATVLERRDDRRGAVAAMVQSGKSSSDIVKSLNIRASEVAAVRRELGKGRDVSKAAVSQRKQDISDMAERGFTTRQIAAAVGVSANRVSEIAKTHGVVIHADRVVGKAKHHDANRIVSRMVQDAENLCADVGLIEFDDLDATQLPEWVSSLQKSREQLGGFIRRLMKEQQKHGQEGVA